MASNIIKQAFDGEAAYGSLKAPFSMALISDSTNLSVGSYEVYITTGSGSSYSGLLTISSVANSHASFCCLGADSGGVWVLIWQKDNVGDISWSLGYYDYVGSWHPQNYSIYYKNISL